MSNTPGDFFRRQQQRERRAMAARRRRFAKLAATLEEEAKIAYVIARKIARDGIPATKYIERPFLANIGDIGRSLRKALGTARRK